MKTLFVKLNGGLSISAAVCVLSGYSVLGADPIVAPKAGIGTYTLGSQIVLSLEIAGENLAFQWFKNESAIQSATNRILSIGALQFSQLGSYRAVVVDRDAVLLSMPTVLTTQNAPLKAWGWNAFGQFGDGTSADLFAPLGISSNIVSVASGRAHSLLLSSEGTLFGAGYNKSGQLGTGDDAVRRSRVRIADDVIAIAAGSDHSMFIKRDGSLWGMGANGNSELGVGSASNQFSPVQISSGVVCVAAGKNHSLFLKADGSLWGMGDNGDGQLGDGTTNPRRVPTKIATNVVLVSAGSAHSIFVKANGSAWAMGANHYGQLGDGTTISRLYPVGILTNGAKAVAAGGFHSLYLKGNGSLWATGANGSGQLGDKSGKNQVIPKLVETNVESVVAGELHSLIVKSDHGLFASGDNSKGQLGIGSSQTVFGFTRAGTETLVVSSLGTVSSGKHSFAIANSPPLLVEVPLQVLDERAPLLVRLTAYDDDLPQQIARFSLVSGPAGMRVSEDGQLNWTPLEWQGPSTNRVHVSVSDGIMSVYTAFTVLVRDSEDPAGVLLPPLTIVVHSTTLKLECLVVPNRFYEVQRADYLGGPWTVVERKISDGEGKVSCQLVLPAEGAGFYRVMDPFD